MGAFKLGTMTLSSLFKKPETVQYPLERKTPPAGLKGHIVIDVNSCILCGICMKNCVTGTIQVDKDKREWSLNPFGCIQCGYCVSACPKHCLSMSPEYWAPASAKEAEVFQIPEKE